jgi:hypothetical protein
MLLNINMRNRLRVEKYGKSEYKDVKNAVIVYLWIKKRALYLVGESYLKPSFLFMSMSVKCCLFMSSKENMLGMQCTFINTYIILALHTRLHS